MLKPNLARIPDARTCLLVLCRRDFAWAREGKGGGRGRSMALARLHGRGTSSDGRQSHDLSKEYCAELVRKGGKEPAI